MAVPMLGKKELIRLMSFNVLQTLDIDEQSAPFSAIWRNRADYNVKTIKRYDPDLIGFQEFDAGHHATYQQQLSGYESFVTDTCGEFMGTAIFWRPERFELIQSGMFWLNRTPEQPGAVWGADSLLPTAWVRLRCRVSGAELLHMNTHLDDESELAPRARG